MYRSKIETTDGITWWITEAAAPTGRDLAALTARRQALAAMEPAPAKAIAARLARLFLRFPAMKNTTGEQVTAYVKDLERFPLWAIDRGIGRIVQGDLLRAGAPSPTSPDVQRAVRAVLEPVREELALLDAVLNATVVKATPARHDAAARKAVADAARAALRAHAPKPPPREERDPRLNGAFDRRRNAAASTPIDLSLLP